MSGVNYFYRSATTIITDHGSAHVRRAGRGGTKAGAEHQAECIPSQRAGGFAAGSEGGTLDVG